MGSSYGVCWSTESSTTTFQGRLWGLGSAWKPTPTMVTMGVLILIIASCTLKLIIYEAHSLKEKRQVIKSLMGRLASRYNISIAEIGLNESWQTSLIGFACVTNSTDYGNEIVSKVINFIDGDTRVEILDHYIELINV